MSATPATAALEAAGIEYVLHPYDHDPANRHFGEEAAAALGVDPLQIFKTLVVEAAGTRPSLAVAVVPVASQLDLKAMASALGAKKVELADPAAAARSSGYVVGGISPIGQKAALPTVIDEAAELFDTVYVSAGKRGLQVELAPAELARVTGARFSDIAR
ncbi:MAG: Cys-tRNA(Pro) deacylase [Propionicimonas sp.]|nr:Cys-tRNA(Pro) deacylase [Propionicimonas sp.]